MTKSGTKTPGQSGPGSNGNEGVFLLPQSSRSGAFPSDGLVSYTEHTWVVLSLCRDVGGVFSSPNILGC